MRPSRLVPLCALALLLLALAFPVLAAPAPPPGATPATLVKVIDGDTIDVLIDDQVERVRYIGVDTPEQSQPGFLPRPTAICCKQACSGPGPSTSCGT